MQSQGSVPAFNACMTVHGGLIRGSGLAKGDLPGPARHVFWRTEVEWKCCLEAGRPAARTVNKTRTRMHCLRALIADNGWHIYGTFLSHANLQVSVLSAHVGLNPGAEVQAFSLVSISLATLLVSWEHRQQSARGAGASCSSLLGDGLSGQRPGLNGGCRFVEAGNQGPHCLSLHLWHGRMLL